MSWNVHLVKFTYTCVLMLLHNNVVEKRFEEKETIHRYRITTYLTNVHFVRLLLFVEVSVIMGQFFPFRHYQTVLLGWWTGHIQDLHQDSLVNSGHLDNGWQKNAEGLMLVRLNTLPDSSDWCLKQLVIFVYLLGHASLWELGFFKYFDIFLLKS
mgnify:CR=1 FL=1